MSKFSSAGQMLHELRPKCDCQTGTTVRIFSLWVQIEVGIAVPSLIQLCRNTRAFTVSNFGHSPVADIFPQIPWQFQLVSVVPIRSRTS